MPRILVIDDEATVRALLDKLLKSAGFDVLLAADGLEGMKLHRAAPADLIITDLFMPNQDGLETIIQVRKLFPKIPIIAMSGNNMGPTMLSIAHTIGAVSVFSKPFVAEELLSGVKEALKGQASPGNRTSGRRPTQDERS